VINYCLFGGVCIVERDATTPVPEFQKQVREMAASTGYEGPIAWAGELHSLEWIDAAADVGADDEIAVGDSPMA